MKRLLLAIIVTGSLVLSFAAFATPAYALSYVALGDSVAAGIGLPGAGNTLDDLRCGRTSSAYPHYVAQSLGTTVTNLACSGAKVNDGFRAEPEDNSVLGAQLGPAFAGEVPDVITVTAGANDMRWHRFVWYCAFREQQDCGTWTQNETMRVLRGDLSLELHQFFTRVQQYSNGSPPKVLVSGYYAPFLPSLTCSDTKGLSLRDQSWLNSQVGLMNRTLRNAIQSYSFAEYVPISFSGHELCSRQPWIQGRADAEPFHPTVNGQRAIAEAMLRVYVR